MYKSVKHKKMGYYVKFCLTMQKSPKHMKSADQPTLKEDFF